MTWVPPYAVDACRKRLDESFEGVGAKDGLTHLGLQFWRPTKEGKLEVVGEFNKIDESTITEFRKWGDAHGVRMMLCVYNGTQQGWDWELAKTAFDQHQERLVKELVAETLRLQFDGVDIDFEGKGKLDSDKEPFVRFIKALSIALKAKGKELTVDSFAYKWHAPNQGWWEAILPHIDALHVMGYSETGAEAADWRSYEFLKAAAGEHSSKLLIGVPSHTAKWQQTSVHKHLDWIAKDPSVGLAIWDARLQDPAWRSKEIWQMLAKIRQAAEGGVDQPATAPESKSEDKEKSKPESEGRSQ